MTDTIIIANDPDGHTRLDDVTFRPLDESFYLGVPKEILNECERRGIDTSFFTQNTPYFYGHDSLATLEHVVGLEGLEEAIQESAVKLAKKFMDRIERAAANNIPAPFNGPTFGVNSIMTSRDMVDERMGIEIGCHHSNYFTSAVMNGAFKILHQRGVPIFNDLNLRRMPQINNVSHGFMFNSFGLHVSVVCEDEYVFGIRPGNLRRHFPVNEGLRPDAEIPANTPFTLAPFYNRAMREELGIKDADQKSNASVRELFFVKSDGTMEIHVLAELKIKKDELLSHYRRAKDAHENDGLVFEPFTRAGLNSILQNSDVGMYDFGREIIGGLAMDLK